MPFRLFQCQVLDQGVKQAMDIFHDQMTSLIRYLRSKEPKVILDDILHDHIKQLDATVQIIRKDYVQVNAIELIPFLVTWDFYQPFKSWAKDLLELIWNNLAFLFDLSISLRIIHLDMQKFSNLLQNTPRSVKGLSGSKYSWSHSTKLGLMWLHKLESFWCKLTQPWTKRKLSQSFLENSTLQLNFPNMDQEFLGIVEPLKFYCNTIYSAQILVGMDHKTLLWKYLTYKPMHPLSRVQL